MNAEHEAREKREFMRAYVIAFVRSNREHTINGKIAHTLKSQAELKAEEARLVWDAIEAEAAK